MADLLIELSDALLNLLGQLALLCSRVELDVVDPLVKVVRVLPRQRQMWEEELTELEER